MAEVGEPTGRAGRRAARRQRRARHGEQPRHWTHRVAGLPWITLVLLLALLLGGVELLRPERYAAQAAVSAPDVVAASTLAVALSSPDLEGRVEQAVELTSDHVGSVAIEVPEDDEPLVVLAEATAPDPRLAALAADTAAALAIGDAPDAGYTLERPAVTPTEPLRPRSVLWAGLGLLALLAALRAEGAHRLWLRDHPDAVAEGAR